jgi:DNA-binding transcriptional MocR family regulator
VAVTSGALDGVERVLREHLRTGDRVLVEDPCFTGISDLLASLALTPIPVAVDDEGMRPASLAAALKRNAGAIIVTPRAQNPTGAALSARRARALRALLHHRPGVLVVEDDHAGAVAGAPYQTLVAPSTSRWAVIRSVSKSLGPDLRLALVAGDETTIARLEGRQTLGIRWVSHVLQKLVAAMLRDRAIIRLLHRAASAYADRRAAAMAALAEHGITAHGASGLNIWIPVPDEISVIHALMQRGWAVQPGSRYRMEAPPAIRVTTATLTREDAARFARDLAAAIAPGRMRVSSRA